MGGRREAGCAPRQTPRSTHASPSLSSHVERLVHQVTLQASPPWPTYLWVMPVLCGSNTLKASPKSLSRCPTGRWACRPLPPRRPNPERCGQRPEVAQGVLAGQGCVTVELFALSQVSSFTALQTGGSCRCWMDASDLWLTRDRNTHGPTFPASALCSVKSAYSSPSQNGRVPRDVFGSNRFHWSQKRGSSTDTVP